MDKALLLWGGDGIIGGIEVRNENAVKVLEQRPQEITLSRRPIHEHNILEIGKDPDVSRPCSKRYLRLIYLQDVTREDSTEQFFVRRSVVAGHKTLKNVDMASPNMQAKELP